MHSHSSVRSTFTLHYITSCTESLPGFVSSPEHCSSVIMSKMDSLTSKIKIVINLNFCDYRISKTGWLIFFQKRKIFRDWSTHTQHKGSSCFFNFFLTFYTLWWGCSQNTWTDFNAQYVIRRHLLRVRPVSRNEKYRSMSLTLKRSKSAILFDLNNFDPNFF